jgi:ribosome-binding factor A
MGRNQENRGASHRVQRVEREVRDVVGTLLLAGLSSDVPSFVSVTRVQMSADLRIARVHVVSMSQVPKPESTLDEEKNEAEDREYKKKIAVERKGIVKALNEHAYEVQQAIARKLQMRFTPRVTFFYDEGFDNALKIESILGKLGQKTPPRATDDE